MRAKVLVCWFSGVKCDNSSGKQPDLNTKSTWRRIGIRKSTVNCSHWCPTQRTLQQVRESIQETVQKRESRNAWNFAIHIQVCKWKYSLIPLTINVNAIWIPDTAVMTTVNVACDCKEKGTPTWTPDGTDRQTYIPDCTWAHQTMTTLKMWDWQFLRQISQTCLCFYVKKYESFEIKSHSGLLKYMINT